MDKNQISAVLNINDIEDFRKGKSKKKYDGMVSQVMEEDPKVLTFIKEKEPLYRVQLFRIDTDEGPSRIKIHNGGKRPTVRIPKEDGIKIEVPIPEREAPPVNWNYTLIGERNIFDLGEILLCDVIRIGRFSFNHFYPIMKSGSFDLTVSREHGLIMFYRGSIQYIDYGSLQGSENEDDRKQGSTNGTWKPDGSKIQNGMEKWEPFTYLEFGQTVDVYENKHKTKKHMFRLYYEPIQKKGLDVQELKSKRSVTSFYSKIASV